MSDNTQCHTYIYKNNTVNLGLSTRLFHIFEKCKEQVSFQTMVVGNSMLVLANGNKTLTID